MHRTLDLLAQHRSIRRYTDDPVPDEHIEAAAAAGQRASTSSAIEAYCCLRVRDPAIRARLVELTGGQEKVASAGAFLVVCGDTRRHRLVCPDYDAGLEAFLLAVVDASLFAQNMVIAFEAMGYGICYVGGLRNRIFDVDALLGIPDGVYPLYGLCVGRPAERPAARPRLPLAAVLLEERYPDDAEMRARIAEHDEGVRRYYERRGQPPRAWSETMAAKFARRQRTDVAAYYTSKGARLD